MSTDINRLRRSFRRLRIDTDSSAPSQAQELFDPSFSFSPEPQEHWTFEDSRIVLNGEDASELIDHHRDDIGFLSGFSGGLELYRRHVGEGSGEQRGKFFGVVQGLQEKIHRRLTGIYETLTSGVHVELSSGQLWINNIDVRAVMSLYRLRPTQKARVFLRGVRHKLALILGRGTDRHALEQTLDEIDTLLDTRPPADLLCLPCRHC